MSAVLALPLAAIQPRAKRRMVVLSVSAGNGHLRAAQALCAAAQDWQDLEVQHIDVLSLAPFLFRKLYADLYLKLVQSLPSAWSALYRHTDLACPESRTNRVRRRIEHACTRALRRRLAQLAPDIIVCTHFLPAEMLGRLPEHKRPAAPLYVQVTDYDLHSMWLQPNVAGYFVASEELAWQLRQRGVPAARVHVSGIPVMPGFVRPPARAEARKELGLPEKRFVILLMGGGHGHGEMARIAQELLSLPQAPVVLAVAGRNAANQAALEVLARETAQQLRVFGFTDRIPVLMRAADFAVSKPGGLTTAECLALGLPLIAVDSIPGQEERNADYLLEHGAALKAVSAARVQYRARQLLDDPARLARMREAARALGKPQAAGSVLRITLGLRPVAGDDAKPAPSFLQRRFPLPHP